VNNFSKGRVVVDLSITERKMTQSAAIENTIGRGREGIKQRGRGKASDEVFQIFLQSGQLIRRTLLILRKLQVFTCSIIRKLL
jgi:hypothetical protein